MAEAFDQIAERRAEFSPQLREIRREWDRAELAMKAYERDSKASWRIEAAIELKECAAEVLQALRAPDDAVEAHLRAALRRAQIATCLATCAQTQLLLARNRKRIRSWSGLAGERFDDYVELAVRARRTLEFVDEVESAALDGDRDWATTADDSVATLSQIREDFRRLEEASPAMMRELDRRRVSRRRHALVSAVALLVAALVFAVCG